jgi:hypothetical protein
MTINPPRVAAGPTVQRRHVLNQPVNVNRTFDPSTSTPDYEGQLIFDHYQMYDDTIQFGFGHNLELYGMYVGVNVDGTLRWVSVAMRTFEDRYTGAEVDPMRFGRGTLG